MNRFKNFIGSFYRVTSKSKFIPELDGLRFLAIISVLLFHSNGRMIEYFAIQIPVVSEFLKSGYFGVEIFFAISGYILTKQILAARHFAYGDYILRRVMRIEPTFFIAITLQFLILLYIKPDVQFELAKSLVQVLTYSSNILGNNKINGVTWSLEIEVQFYLMLPFLLLTLKSGIKTFYFSLLTLLACSLLINYFIDVKAIFGFIHWFLVGVVIAQIHHKEIKINTYFYLSNMLLVLALFVFALDYFDFFGVYRVIIQIGCLLLLFNNVLILRKGIKFLSLPIVAIIGGMCYSIYLYHIIILSLGVKGFFPTLKTLLTNDYVFYFAAMLFMIVGAILFSAVMFKVFERPFMRRDWHKYYSNKLRRLED